MATATTETLGPIQSGVIYPLSDFMKRIGWGRHAMRAARRRGLRVRYMGGRGFVRGEDFLDYLEKCDESEAAAATA